MGCHWVGGHPDPLSRIILRLLSRESPSGTMKAVLRKAGNTGEEKQFLEVSLHRTRWWAAGGSVPPMRLLLEDRQPDYQMSSGLGEEPEAQELQPVSAGETWAGLRGW